ncbi:enoyl-CoA hydratase/isomerase family protein [Brevibacillus sp. B_LB10_24]|uniref:enoyl-CoA hydratase/isomerase family protein n=1 Tax=Brevibacillus sp. B_LB10_24 TaxID=3380645 RepID=UPI0038B745FF
MSREDILLQVEGNVLAVTLNRPQSLNVFSPDMLEGMMEAIQRAKEDPDIRAVLLSGAGRAFSAGGDVKRMEERMGDSGPVLTYEHIGRLNKVILAMADLDVPIVAAVHGYAAGAGVCLAMACDQILAAQDCKFVLSFAKVGLISDGGCLFFLPRTLGLYRAKEVLFNAEPIEAATAYSWGMVNRLYPSEQLLPEAMKYARKLAEGPSRAIGMMKRIANRALISDLEGILEMERTAQAMIKTTHDHSEGVKAFIEKRSPQFFGK